MNKTLKSLDLGGFLLLQLIKENFIKEEGAKALADALKENNSLFELNLSGSLIKNNNKEIVLKPKGLSHLLMDCMEISL